MSAPGNMAERPDLVATIEYLSARLASREARVKELEEALIRIADAAEEYRPNLATMSVNAAVLAKQDEVK